MIKCHWLQNWGAHYTNSFGSIRKRANSFEWIPKFASCFCALRWVLFFPVHSVAIRCSNMPTKWNDSRCHAFWSTNQPFCLICSMFSAFGRHHSLFHFAQSWRTSGWAYFMYTTASTTGPIQMNWPLRIIKFVESSDSRRPPLFLWSPLLVLHPSPWHIAANFGHSGRRLYSHHIILVITIN